MLNADRKIALVTGASRGIGASVALRLAADGFHVIVNYINDVNAAQSVVDKIRADGGYATPARADISDITSVRTMFHSIYENHGNIDVLVNNAGIQKLGLISEVSDEDFDTLVRINLKAPFNTLREVSRTIKEGGRIINLSSGTTRVLHPRYGVYAATKAALEAMTTVLAKEMHGRQITVNAIAPGPVATELFLKDKTPEQLDAAAMQSPLQRLGLPSDIAGVVSFLAGPDGAWINGQTLIVNGAYI